MEKTAGRSIFARREIDMTQGSIISNLLKFAFPLLLGNLFQQLYNMVDLWVIGQTRNNDAYAAVGSVGPIINILIGLFSGFASGAGVIISQYYGAKNNEKVKEVTHTAMALTFIMSAIFTVIGLAISPALLKLMLSSQNDASSVYPYAKTYLLIYFAGVTGLLIYNMGAGILRAVGDSTRPFYYLVAAAVTNIVLDMVFVFAFDMGVAGVALATIIAQFLSAMLTVAELMRTKSCVRFSFKNLCLDLQILKKIAMVGAPAALQMALTAFSNVFVQSYIAGVNGDQTLCLSGWTSYSKIDQFIFLPMQSLSLAATTFVGQNLGNGDIKRAKKGTYTAYFMATGITVILIVLVMAFAPQVASVFNDDKGVVDYAVKLLRALTPFYIFCCVNQVFSAALRGAGNAKAPMLIMLGTFVIFRQVYLFVVSNYISNELLPVAFGYPAGWFLCCVITLIYYKKVGFQKTRIFSEE